MKVEKSFCGEFINVQMKVEESGLLYSFLEFHLRNRLSDEIVSTEEYDLMQVLVDEICLYLDDNYPTHEEISTVELLINEYRKGRI